MGREYREWNVSNVENMECQGNVSGVGRVWIGLEDLSRGSGGGFSGLPL